MANSTANSTESPVSGSDGISIFLFTVQMISMVLIIFGNTLTIAAVIKFQFLRTVSNIFTVSLAFSDLLIAFVLPLSSLIRFTDLLNDSKAACWLSTMVIVMSQGTSLLTLMAMAIDRFTAVIYPLRYEELMTQRRAFVMIAVLWVYTFLVVSVTVPAHGAWPVEYCAIVHLVPPVIYNIFYFGSIFSSFVIIMSLYTCIFYVAWKQARMIDNQSTAVTGMNSVSNIHQRRVTKMVAFVLGTFVVCWVPYIISNPLRKLLGTSVPWLNTFYKFSITFLYANSFMNPMIYVWKNRMYRVAFKRLLGLRWEDDVDDIHNNLATTSNGSSQNEATAQAERY